MDRDLDSITLKALARDPDERYGSAAQFADDIRNYLDGLPVSAVGRSRLYVARKFVGRNRLAVAAAGVLLLSMAAGLAGTLWQARAARQERANAEQRFNDAHKLANYLLFELYDAVAKLPGTLPVRADMARRALEYLDRLSAIKSDDPAMREELAEGYLKLGTVFGRRLGLGDRLGDTAQAIAIDRKGLAIADSLVREQPGHIEARRTQASLQEQLGAALSTTGQYNEAFVWLRKAAEAFDAIAAAHPNDVRSLRDSGSAWHTYGKQLSDASGYVTFDTDKARACLQKSVAAFEAALRIDPANAQALQLLAVTYESVGRIDSMLSPSQGIQDYTAALNQLARLPAADKRSTCGSLRAMGLANVGWDEGQLNDFNAALASLEEARAVLDELAAADPENVGAATGAWIVIARWG